MKKIDWVNFIHIYQPPWQRAEIVHQVTQESYQFLLSYLKQFPSFHISLNIAGTLLEQLIELGYSDLINDIQTLLKQGQIELTGSSHSHAFLPLLPATEVIHQIELQEQTMKKYFPGVLLKGFFLPEMAYTQELGTIIKKLGYAWIILDPRSAKIKSNGSVKYLDRRTGLTVVFRNRTLSRSYPPEAIYNILKEDNENHDIVVTASDGELYGHFHKDWQDHLKRVLRSNRITTHKVSDYIAELSDTKPIYLHRASWETRSKQLRGNNAFSIWYNKNNPIHKQLWQLAHLAISTIAQHPRDPNLQWARFHLDRGLASCSWWWASEIKTSVFAPIGWSPDEIERGALELIKSVRSLNKLNPHEKIKAEKIYFNLLHDVWRKHWRTYGK